MTCAPWRRPLSRAEDAESPCPGGWTRGFRPATSGYALGGLRRSCIAEFEENSRLCIGVCGLASGRQAYTLAAGQRAGHPQDVAGGTGDDLQVHPVAAVLAVVERPVGGHPV